MENVIRTRLEEIERSEDVQIIYACESGSRAWGFPSIDSDYDIRFIYVSRIEKYLSIFEQRDVIEKPLSDELDISGWDIKKALRLFAKSKWIEQELGPVPTDFNHLVEKLLPEGDLKSAIAKLLKIKRSGAELNKGPRIEVIGLFIESELDRLEKKEIPKNKLDLPYGELDKLFRETLRRAWEK